MKFFLLSCFACILSQLLFSQQYPVDSVTFEVPSSRLRIDTSTGNLWQIGVPQKSFFSGGHSPSHAIVTDTLSPYPANNVSSFIYVLYSHGFFACGHEICFWHKYDMEPGQDIGVIDASYDDGQSWDTLTWTAPLDHIFEWQMDYHEATGNYSIHDNIVTGTSDGWIKSCFYMQWHIGVKMDTIPLMMPDSVLIRFTFKSNGSNNNYEGWMIDDIVLDSLDPNECAGGIAENAMENKVVIFPNPVVSDAQIRLTDPAFRPRRISVYNVWAEEVWEKGVSASAHPMQFNFNDLESGIYLLAITDGNGKTIRKRFLKL